MTRQHFELIASTLRDSSLWFGDAHQARIMVREFADRLARTNARFDRDRFIKAASPTTEEYPQ